jgi:hypothetical protein
MMTGTRTPPATRRINRLYVQLGGISHTIWTMLTATMATGQPPVQATGSMAPPLETTTLIAATGTHMIIPLIQPHMTSTLPPNLTIPTRPLLDGTARTTLAQQHPQGGREINGRSLQDQNGHQASGKEQTLKIGGHLQRSIRPRGQVLAHLSVLRLP